MSMSKKKVLAGVLSCILLLTSVFTGNLLTAKAGEGDPGSVNISAADYAPDDHGEMVYVVNSDAALGTVVIPENYHFVIDNAVVSADTVTIAAGGTLEIFGAGNINATSLVPTPGANMFLGSNANVPTGQTVYDVTGEAIDITGDDQWNSFFFTYLSDEFFTGWGISLGGGGGDPVGYGKNGILAFHISHPENGDVRFKIGDSGTVYRVGGDETNDESAIISALENKEFTAGETITVWAQKHEGANVSHFDIQIDGLSVFANNDEREAAKLTAQGESGYTLTVPMSYSTSQPIEFQFEYLIDGGDGGEGGPGGPGGDSDLTIAEDTTLSSAETKTDITVTAGVLTIDNCSVRVDHKLDVKSGANVVGTSASSELVFAGHAFSSGLILYYSDGEKATGGPEENYENRGDGPVTFTWNVSLSRWETDQRPVDDGGGDLPWYTVSYGSSANLTTEHGQVYAERVHIGDITYTTIASEYNASETDKIYSMEDTIFHQKTAAEESDPTYEDPLTRYGIGGSDGDIFIRSDVSGVSIDFKFIPDFGYQLTNVYTNENEEDRILDEFVAASAISSFKFDVIQGRNVHFEVKYEAVSNTVTGNAEVASSAKIASANAAASGTLEMKVDTGTPNTANIPAGAQSLAAYDITLTNLVSKGGGRGNWSTALEDLGSSKATVTIPVEDTTNYTYAVIREHSGEIPVLLEATITEDGISFETNKFSTYTIVKTPRAKSIAAAEITLGTELTYNGSAQTQTVTSVAIDGTVLDPATDYEITNATKTLAGTYLLTVTGKGNYVGSTTKEFTIAKATLTPSISGTATKVYDGTATATGLSISLTGKMGSDDVSASALKYEYDSATAGTGKTITATGITLRGSTLGNYVLSSESATLTSGEITAATPTITLSNLTETTLAPTGVKATLSPTDAGASVKIEYEVVKTPAKPAQPCKYANGHLATCATKEDASAACDCGYEATHVHDSECGFASAEAAVMEWTITRPTTPGTYNVRATLPTPTTNLADVTVPVTGVYTLTAYTAPASSTSGSSGNANVTPKDNQETKTEEKKPEAPKPESPAEETPQEVVKAPEVVKNNENTTTITMGSDSDKNWNAVKEEITKQIAEVLAETADSAQSVTPVIAIEMKEESVVPSEIFEAIKGKDVEVAFEMSNGITWTINGQDVVADSFGEINFNASTGNGVTAIPNELIAGLSGDRFSMELSLEHDGVFGFTAKMTINVNKENAGKFANLFYFNPETQAMEFICAAEISEDGSTDLTFVHASDYVILVDDVPLSANDNTTLEQVKEMNKEVKDVEAASLKTNFFAKNLIWFVVIGVIVIIVIVISVFAFRKKENSNR